MSKLVACLEAAAGKRVRADKQPLRAVDDEPEVAAPLELDRITRESHLRIIRHLRRRYRLGLLVDQATFGKAGLNDLDDAAVVALHRQLDRARECLEDGVSFEEAGLIRSQGGKEAWG